MPAWRAARPVHCCTTPIALPAQASGIEAAFQDALVGWVATYVSVVSHNNTQLQAGLPADAPAAPPDTPLVQLQVMMRVCPGRGGPETDDTACEQQLLSGAVEQTLATEKYKAMLDVYGMEPAA